LIEVRSNLDAANDDIGVKDDYIQILQFTQAKREVEIEAEEARNQARNHPSSPFIQPPTHSQHFTRPSAVVEDSQPANDAVVAPADLLSDPFMGNGYEGSQPPLTEADLPCLFPVTPLAQKKTLNADPHFSTSRGNMASPQVGDPREEQRKSFSRQVLSETRSEGISDASRQASRPASRVQRPAVTMPRSILKDPRAEKRPAAAAGITTSMTAPKKRKSSLAGLGPVIADSQSPERLLLGKGRKQSTKPKRTAKGETEVHGYWTTPKNMFL